MKTIIAGSRTVYRFEKVEKAMSQWPHPVTEVVSGHAAGVDKLGERWARKYGIPIKRFPADWEKDKRSAGPIRNWKMAQYAEALVAIWDGKSPGTKNMIESAKKRGLVVKVFLLADL